jgi:hypothetical protein
MKSVANISDDRIKELHSLHKQTALNTAHENYELSQVFSDTTLLLDEVLVWRNDAQNNRVD